MNALYLILEAQKMRIKMDYNVGGLLEALTHSTTKTQAPRVMNLSLRVYLYADGAMSNIFCTSTKFNKTALTGAA